VLDPREAEAERQAAAKEARDDPFANDPERHPALHLHSRKPCNAELPAELLTENYITPAELWYIRHHNPVPQVHDAENTFRLTVDLGALGRGKRSFSLAELRALPQHRIVATMQCSGNRRRDMSQSQKTSGTYWGQGAISTAQWEGPRLLDVLRAAGVSSKELEDLEDQGVNHVCFRALDSVSASITAERATRRSADVILALKMNGDTLPRDHGFPVRAVVPGVVGVRNVKWVDQATLSAEEALGDWQRGLNYKILPPNLWDAKNVDLTSIPAMQEASVFSGITHVEQAWKDADHDDDEGGGHQQATSHRHFVDAKGWAWAGGGRGVARVDVSADGGETWTPAQITHGGNQKPGREWAWVFWQADGVPAERHEDGTARVISRAVDKAYNAQPEQPGPIWNIRGLGNNSWFAKNVELEAEEDEGTLE